MGGRWIRRIAMMVTIVLAADAVFAAQAVPGWATNIEAGADVRVTMRSGEAFDAIWMGRDGDRAVFERFYPHETISVPLDAVRKVKTRAGSSSPNAAAIGALGAAVGFFGASIVLGLLLRGT